MSPVYNFCCCQSVSNCKTLLVCVYNQQFFYTDIDCEYSVPTVQSAVIAPDLPTVCAVADINATDYNVTSPADVVSEVRQLPRPVKSH